jgi:hypothetical protein
MTWYHVWHTGSDAQYINAPDADAAAFKYALGRVRFTNARIYVCEEDDAKVFNASVTPGETHHEGPK